MAVRYPAEFRRRAVELARLHEKPILRIAHDLGISDATLHGWLKQADIDEGRADGLTTEERVLSELRARRLTAQRVAAPMSDYLVIETRVPRLPALRW